MKFTGINNDGGATAASAGTTQSKVEGGAAVGTAGAAPEGDNMMAPLGELHKLHIGKTTLPAPP